MSQQQHCNANADNQFS